MDLGLGLTFVLLLNLWVNSCLRFCGFVLFVGLRRCFCLWFCYGVRIPALQVLPFGVFGVWLLFVLVWMCLFVFWWF